MTTTALNNLAAVSPTIKESETMRTMIAQNRGQIANLKTRRSAILDKLRDRRTAPTTDHDEAQEQLASIAQGIQNLEHGIAMLENRLPQVMALENVLDRLGVQAAKEAAQREREQTQAHERAVKDAALVEWLKTPGQTAQGFESAWPTISHQIAMQSAVEAGQAESQVDHTANFTAKITQDFLNAKYGGA